MYFHMMKLLKSFTVTGTNLKGTKTFGKGTERRTQINDRKKEQQFDVFSEVCL